MHTNTGSKKHPLPSKGDNAGNLTSEREVLCSAWGTRDLKLTGLRWASSVLESVFGRLIAPRLFSQWHLSRSTYSISPQFPNSLLKRRHLWVTLLFQVYFSRLINCKVYFVSKFGTWKLESDWSWSWTLLCYYSVWVLESAFLLCKFRALWLLSVKTTSLSSLRRLE